MKNDKDREWVHIGGDLEASFDGFKYVDIRSKGKSDKTFLSISVVENALLLFPSGIALESGKSRRRLPKGIKIGSHIKYQYKKHKLTYAKVINIMSDWKLYLDNGSFITSTECEISICPEKEYIIAKVVES